MKTILKLLLSKISRVIYFLQRVKHYITPIEAKDQKLRLKLEDELIDQTFNHFKEDFKKSLLFDDKWKLRKYAVETSLLNDQNEEFFYLEFGVWIGRSTNYFSKLVKKLYCFDSFEGIKEDWVGTDLPRNYFSLNKKIPKLNSNVEPVVGWVEDTLDDFLKKHNPKINFIHLDMDTYSPTKFTLEKLKPYMVKNAIIIFDEYYNYIGWENGEYKALNEVFKKDEFEYKAFCLSECQVAIQIK